MQKKHFHFDFVSVHAYLFLHRDDLSRSLTNGNHFSSIHCVRVCDRI